MAYQTAITITVGFDTPDGGRAFLGEGQSIEAFRPGVLRKSRRKTKFRLRALLAPITTKLNSASGLELTLTCAPNSSKIDDVSPDVVSAAHQQGVGASCGESAAYKSVLLSDPGGLITIDSGHTPGLLAIDSDHGTPFYHREPVSVDVYHRLLYREMEGGPRIHLVEELELPSFWKPDPSGNYSTFNMNTMQEERVSPLQLPLALMKADEFMDAGAAKEWAVQAESNLLKELPMLRPDVIFGYASPGEFSGNKNLRRAEDLGSPGCRPITQIVTTEEAYLPSVLRATNHRARALVTTGESLTTALV